MDTPPADTTPETGGDESEPETFDRDYVKSLREESARYRVASAKHDETKARLHAELTKADGRLADWRDLPYDETHLTDSEAHKQAITDLLAERPHYASRRPAPGSSIGQGIKGAPVTPKLDLVGAMRQVLGY
ncbi:hypothetical protein [Mycobacterium sp.]|uniref:hypothetical protein n=1 Tax=Mycobacterium sp. TaxID=1785 RepID=UPI003F99A8D7